MRIEENEFMNDVAFDDFEDELMLDDEFEVSDSGFDDSDFDFDDDDDDDDVYESEFEIEEPITIPQDEYNYILEKGDIIRVLRKVEDVKKLKKYRSKY